MAMVGLGATFPGYADLPLVTFWYPAPLLAITLLIPFSLDFMNRRFSVFAAAFLATPSMMLLPDLGLFAVIFWGGLFLVGLAGILLAVIARLSFELLRG